MNTYTFNSDDPPPWYEQTGARETILRLTQEVITISEYAQEAASDLEETEDLAEVDLDNLQIAVASIHTASERALGQLGCLFPPAVNSSGEQS